MLSSIFDEYSLNARVRPALLALLSLTAFLYLAFPKLYTTLAGSVSIFVFFGLVTAIAHYCRDAGRNVESKLFLAWGGKPTTILLRHRDAYLDPITKNRYHEFLTRNIDQWVAPCAEDELNNPQKLIKHMTPLCAGCLNTPENRNDIRFYSKKTLATASAEAAMVLSGLL